MHIIKRMKHLLRRSAFVLLLPMNINSILFLPHFLLVIIIIIINSSIHILLKILYFFLRNQQLHPRITRR